MPGESATRVLLMETLRVEVVSLSQESPVVTLGEFPARVRRTDWGICQTCDTAWYQYQQR
jgi:hypothetical protein